MGRSRGGQRHRVRRHRRFVSGRRVSGWRQGRGVDGWFGANNQRQLRPIHPRASGQRCPHRVRPTVVTVGGIAGDLRGGVDVSVPQPRLEVRTNTGLARRDIVVRPGGSQNGGRRRCACHRDRGQPQAHCHARRIGRVAGRIGETRSRRPHRRVQKDRRRARPGGKQHHPRLARHAAPRRYGLPGRVAGWA
jgi:hypothetical protein